MPFLSSDEFWNSIFKNLEKFGIPVPPSLVGSNGRSGPSFSQTLISIKEVFHDFNFRDEFYYHFINAAFVECDCTFN